MSFIINGINNTIGGDNSGQTNTLTITNSSNTASSAARASLTVGGASAANPSINFNINGTTDWEMGCDNASSDDFKISQGSALGTNDTFVMTTAGERTLPLQPNFRAILTSNLNNVTGDGTSYPITFDSTDWNVGSVYSTGTGLFTAPVDGYYFFNLRLRFTGLSTSHNNLIMFVDDPLIRLNPGAIMNSSNALGQSASTVLFLNATDTVQPSIVVNGGAKTVSLDDISQNNNVFIGYLLM